MAGNQRPQILSFILHQFGMWPWASYESKIYNKRSNNALHVHGILWFNSTLSHTISHLILPPASWEEYSSIIKFSIIKNRDLRLRETKSLVHSHINSKWQSTNSFRCGSSLCHPTNPHLPSLVFSNIISLDEQCCLTWWTETTQCDGTHELWFILIKTYSQ